MAENKAEKEVLRAAIEKWGREAQTKMVLEEMSELQKEICKNWRGQSNEESIAEEIADVEIVLDQLKMIFGVAGKVHAHRIRKIKRLKERLAAAGREASV